MQQPPDPNQQYPQQPWNPQQQWNPQQPPYPPQQYQQPSYPQQPPYQYPPQVPPPKKKSHKGLFIVLGVILAVALIGCIGVAAMVNAGGQAAQQTLNQTSTQVAQLPTTQPTSKSSTQAQTKVGVPFVVNDTWTVTVNKVTTNQGDNLLNTPKAGNIYLVVNVTLKNTSSQNQDASSLGMFSLKDSTGQTYNQNIAFGQSPDGHVAAGSLVRGDIAYEVPKSMHNFILQFVPSFGSSELTEWNLTI
jgi:flagellar basal body-associated protein FliL